MVLVVQNEADIESHLKLVRGAAARTLAWVKDCQYDPMGFLRAFKFEAIGCHPIGGHDLNVIEQINQTFTYAVALEAAKQLLILHPNVGGFRLAPGAHASIPLDIMSVVDGVVGAETFAAVNPRNNGKLQADLTKLASRSERHRYVFFASPRYPEAARHRELERDGVEVWSVSVA